MFYARKIIYLDDITNGEKAGSAGFVKIEVRGEYCNIFMQIKGLREVDSGELQVYLVGDGKEAVLCELCHNQGAGMKQLRRLSSMDMGRTGISFEELEAIRIPLTETRQLYGVMDKSENTACLGPQQNIEKEQTEDVKTEVEIPEEKVQEEKAKKNEMKMCNSKWEQLWQLYPHISPFQDDRTFLSLTPGDFVLLPEKYFKVIHNSFLLHGYYNYKHLILKRMEYRNEVRYYLGVPGNFYDKEKQVAVMFGFESFESLAETAETGDYGYYLMRVEL